METIAPIKLTINQKYLTSENISEAGAKAAGIAILPPKWVPRFFVIRLDFFRRFRKRSRNGSFDISCKQIISEEEFVELNDALDSIGISRKAQVIVRSSSPTESIESRGKFYSAKSDPNVTALLQSCDDIFRKTIVEHCKDGKGIIDLALIVQQYIDQKAGGHLSNERRVARRKQDWLCEFESVKAQVRRFAIKSHTVHASPEELIATTDRELLRKLRQVAAFVDNEGLRLHMEWGWDGQKLWIVQADRDLEKRGSDPGSFLTMVNPVHSGYSLRCFKAWNNITHNKWRKVQCQRDFSDAGLTCSPIWVLEDEAVLASLQQGILSSALQEDLAKVLAYPIVIRTDISGKLDEADDDEDQMLPRSDSVTAVREAEKFLEDSSRSMDCLGKKPGEFCFIVHHYVPARSSAFCLAKPHNPRVRIDSLWGVADGLLFYPYDSFQLDTDSPGKTTKHLRFKDNYLATDPNGRWKPVKAGVPWDWASSVTAEELLLISRGSKKLSDYLGQNVSVMWFLGIPSRTGLPTVLPWWYRSLEKIRGVEPADPRVFGRNIVLLRTKKDLDYLQSLSEGQLGHLLLRLSPEPDLLRERQFLREVAELATRNGLPVELQGSPLQHAYYQLKRLGVRVKCVDFYVKPTSRPQYFRKLVRDQIPERIEIRGEHARISRTSAENLILALREKIIEEAYELFWARKDEDTKEELADILELVISLAEAQGLSLDDLENVAERKQREKGGFQKGLILVETRELPLIETDEERRFIDAEDDGKVITIRSIPRIIEDGCVSVPVIPPGGVREAQLRLVKLRVNLSIRYDQKGIVLRITSASKAAAQKHLPLGK